jgi:hypothetical protein
MAPLTEFHATMADVTNEEHQNMAGLVQSDDFNAEVVVRFLRDNGIDASVDESTGGFRYTAANATRASDVRFACVCLRASISYAIEAAYWCAKAKRRRRTIGNHVIRSGATDTTETARWSHCQRASYAFASHAATACMSWRQQPAFSRARFNASSPANPPTSGCCRPSQQR